MPCAGLSKSSPQGLSLRSSCWIPMASACGTVPQALAIGIQQEDRSERPCGELFDKPAQGIEDHREGLAFGDHLEQPFLSCQQGLGALALRQVEHECDALVLPALEHGGADQDWHATAVF